MSKCPAALLAELIAEVKGLREDQRLTRLMMARALTFQMSSVSPISVEHANRVEARLMMLDEPK